MLEDIKEIICEYVDIDPEQITEQSSLRNDLGATSFDLMNIAVCLENTYHISLPDSRLPLIKTVGDIIKLIESSR